MVACAAPLETGTMGEPVGTEVKEAAVPEHGVVEAAERVIIFGVKVELGGHGE